MHDVKRPPDSYLLTGPWTYNTAFDQNVSESIALIYMYYTDNQLTVLDVSKNAALTYLDCYSTPYLKEIWLKYGQKIPHLEYDRGVTIKYVD